MNWKGMGLTIAATFTLAACGAQNDQNIGQGDMNDGVQQTRFNSTTDYPTNRGDLNPQYNTNDYGANRGTYDGTYQRGNDVDNDNRNELPGTRNVQNAPGNIDLNIGKNNQNKNRNIADNKQDENRFEIADRAADRITEQVKQVDRAYVLTTENNAYVATQLTNNTDEISNEVKDSVSRAVKSVDPGIENVYVSTNPDFVDLTNNYVNDAENGEPVEGFFDQMGQMIERIFPNRG
ncbi:YhcN/YlaJ family sporulation lipoprotein [Aquibacillus kalidii]|uniref:YhcN/YlaJ family sporulation lipoprotein n=1 Tax=Aquibacillus kalidii TaxID=2762597 RepID=UPI001645FF68|nr:YhcN/YlaJ family sporulation lipoprotein [Aquibacillus kalidii]